MIDAACGSDADEAAAVMIDVSCGTDNAGLVDMVDVACGLLHSDSSLTGKNHSDRHAVDQLDLLVICRH